MIPFEWFEQARQRISAHIDITPVKTDHAGQFFYKLENRQITGSFKLRGALNKVLTLQAWERANGLVAASAGNHGQGVAVAAGLTGTFATIFVPEDVSPVKLTAMDRLGAKTVLVPGGYELAEQTAQQYASDHHAAWISPYNDGQVIAGQGTIALELVEQLDLRSITACVLPVGGGGLIAGMGLVLKHLAPGIRIIGVQPQGSRFMHGLFYRNNQDDFEEQLGLADGLEGRVEDHSITVPIVKSVVDEIILVTEEEIGRAIAYAWHHLDEIIEGSAAVTLAGILSGKIKESPTVMVFSGGNITPSLHEKVRNNHREIDQAG